VSRSGVGVHLRNGRSHTAICFEYLGSSGQLTGVGFDVRRDFGPDPVAEAAGELGLSASLPLLGQPSTAALHADLRFVPQLGGLLLDASQCLGKPIHFAICDLART
jgi:hypothetical protein